MTDFENLLTAASNFRCEDHRIVLVTQVDRAGSSPRPIGSQMVVCEDGRYIGHLTGGCAEHVIVEDSLVALSEGKNRHLRLGAGSPYFDISLPCGAGIDLFIDVHLGDHVLAELNRACRARVPVALDTSKTVQYSHRCVYDQNSKPSPEVYRRWYYPKRRLIILGKGPNVMALARLALASEYEVLVGSPDRNTLAEADRQGADVQLLSTPAAFSPPVVDQWTAAVLMFHEHDWEPDLLEKLLSTCCFYIGALGSHRTHQQRLNILAGRGVLTKNHRLHGPVGLAIGAATPTEIAVSILAEMTQIYRQTSRPLLVN